ncbi:MAG: penicillin-binding transpeptidase domain-containing protein [Chloroflexota bacterium]
MNQTPLTQRINRLFLFILGIFVIMMGGYLYWGILRSPFLAVQSDNPRTVERELRVQRGAIYDSNLTALAENRLEGEISIREYPFPSASSAVGYYSLRFGVSGIEQSLDDLLRGNSDQPEDIWYREVVGGAQVGADVRLTLDVTLQERATDHFARFDAEGALLLVTTDDGTLKTMVSQPTFDPNLIDEQFETYIDDEDSPLLNRATQNRYQPGKILAPFWILIALHDGLISSAELDANGIAGTLELLAGRWSNEDVLGAMQRLGLTGEPNIGLDVGSQAAALDLTQLATVGEELNGEGRILITPLMLAQSALYFGQDGDLPPLRLISATRDSEDAPWVAFQDGDGIESIQVLEDGAPDLLPFQPQVINGQIMDQMEADDLFAEWTARVDAGPEMVNSWYIGFAPARDPRFVVVIVLEDQSDSQIAAEIGRDLLTEALK